MGARERIRMAAATSGMEGARMAGAISGVDGGGGGRGPSMAAAGVPHNFVLDHVSPATRLLEKRRQMFEIQEALEAQKEEFSRCDEENREYINCCRRYFLFT